MAAPRYQAQDSFTVTISGFPQSYFTTFNAVTRNRRTTTFADGRSANPVTVIGSFESTELTLSKPYDLNNDPALLRSLESWVDGVNAPYTITVTPVDRRTNSSTGPAMVYTGCKPTGHTLPAVNANEAGTPATIELRFTTRSVKVG